MTNTNGTMMARPPYPDVDYLGKVRAHDPDTSWDAASQQTRTKTRRLRLHLLDLLGHYGPLIDDELVEAYRTLYLARSAADDPIDFATPQSIRSRRSELRNLGRVRVSSEPKRPSNNGSPSTVWELVA